MTRRLVAIIVWIFVLGDWLPAAPEIAGSYTCEGENAQGDVYQLTLTVSRDASKGR